ncbi:MAG: signal peptidase I [Acidimicrobiales bacterium]
MTTSAGGAEAEAAAVEAPTRADGDGSAPPNGGSPGAGTIGQVSETVDDGDEPSDAPAGEGDDGDEAAKGDGQKRKARSRTRTVVEWAAVIGGALLVALVVRSTLAQAFWIPSPSMEPTLQEGDRVLVNKLSYRLHDVHRGDVIVFERPESAISANPEDDISDLIKRVIGLPGDIIESRPDGSVYINDHRLDEPYLPEGTRTTNLVRQEVPADHVFVMGDNRGNSADSREFGPVEEGLIVGRAFVRIWPLGDIGGL